MIIIAGLGNPGAKYEKNRHNIGFMAVDEIASRWRFGPERAKFQSIVSEGEVEGTKVLLMKPQTYMNESGRAVGEAMRFYQATPADVIAKLNQAINTAAQSKDLQEKFAATGFAIDPGTPEALAQRNKAETAKWAKAIRDAKIEQQ